MNTFESLSSSINALHVKMQYSAVQSVNRMLSMRNWLIGKYIVEYEQNGEDRAKYGDSLLDRLSESLRKGGTKGMAVVALRSYRLFYSVYPQLSVIFDLNHHGQELKDMQIQQTPSVELQFLDKQCVNAHLSLPEMLIKHFSFSHFVELLRISDPLKRSFYEIEGIRGCWSVAQLKRQIESLLYERTALSGNKAGVVDAVHNQHSKMTIEQIIRDPYILEFTGFPEKYEFSENELESRLLDNIQSFLLELGNGFCFESRQKRITLDNEHDRIDLVFYHRILRCHILIDLKVRKFKAGDAGQMNFYLNYFKKNVMQDGDNPPVGLILCTARDETRVEYATSGLDNSLFVSKYLTQLPSENTIREFLVSDRERVVTKLQEELAPYYVIDD